MSENSKKGSLGFVVLAVIVVGAFVLTKGKKQDVNTKAEVEVLNVANEAPAIEVNNELTAQAVSTVAGGDTTVAETTPPVGGTVTVTNAENKLSEAEVKELRFCSPKDVSECKVCLTKNCIPEDSNSLVSCYTKTENCVSDQPQRRLSMTEIKHFDKIQPK